MSAKACWNLKYQLEPVCLYQFLLSIMRASSFSCRILLHYSGLEKVGEIWSSSSLFDPKARHAPVLSRSIVLDRKAKQEKQKGNRLKTTQADLSLQCNPSEELHPVQQSHHMSHSF